MTNDELVQLKALAEAVQGWSNVNTVWRDKEEDMPIVGHIDEDGFKYPVLTVDTAQYFDEKDDLAQFYAAANPATILALVAKVESLAADAERWKKFERALRAGHIPGAAHGRRFKIIENCPMYGEEKEFNDFIGAINAMAKEKA